MKTKRILKSELVKISMLLPASVFYMSLFASQIVFAQSDETAAASNEQKSIIAVARLLTDKEVVYSHRLFKQPGTNNDPFSFTLSYPKIYKAHDLPADFSVKDHVVSFTKNLSQDREFELHFFKE